MEMKANKGLGQKKSRHLLTQPQPQHHNEYIYNKFFWFTNSSLRSTIFTRYIGGFNRKK